MNPSNLQNTITIDGPAGAGKSTIARNVAERLGYFYLDTGAMYRSVAWKVLEAGIDPEREDAVAELFEGSDWQVRTGKSGTRYTLDGKDLTDEIRSSKVTEMASRLAQYPSVRMILVGWQRKLASQRPSVIEGRDTGTVVFPDAGHKFYLDADPEERARRRMKELEEKGEEVAFQSLCDEIRERDRRDMTREIAPLKKADDAISVDTTGMSIDEVIQTINRHIHSNL